MQDNNQQLYAIPITQKKVGQTPVYRHPDSKEQLFTAPKNVNNLADLWDISLKKFQNKKLIEEMTYKQIDDILKSIGSWFMDNKIQKLYLFAKNSPQWTLTDLAAWNYNLITIPLYETLGNESFDHIIQKTEGTALIVSQVQADKLINHLKKQKGMIDTIIFIDNIPAHLKEQFNSLGIKLFTFDEVKQNKKLLQRPKMNLDSHITYIYTSGTTGIPKGVVYTHQMIITQLFALQKTRTQYENNVHMSFLPIAHAFERAATWNCIFKGSNIRYAKHPITEILKDYATIKPTTLIMVPRMLNKLYQPMKQLSQTQNGKAKVKQVFGGNARVLATGSAAVRPQVLYFFKDILQCNIGQGYGQTETCAASFTTHENQTNFNHVGGPNKSIQYKLVDVPQMNYTSETNPPRGQVCFRGKSIFKQYYKNPQATKETIDSDGWIHSGDIGAILPGGALQIIDRKKSIFKLSQGQYVAPEKIQNIYMRCKYVSSCFVIGQPLQSCLLGFINPTPELLPVIAKQLGIVQTDMAKLCENSQINKFILQEMNKQAEIGNLNGLQKIKKLKLVAIPFTNLGIFTSTLKIQRHIAKKVFEEDIKSMYKQVNQA